jgi:hypothetical protein
MYGAQAHSDIQRYRNLRRVGACSRARRIGVMKHGRLGFKPSRAGQAVRVQAARTGPADAAGLDKTPAPPPGLNPADVPSPGVQAGPARVSDRTDRSDLEPPDLPDLEGSDLEDDRSEPAGTVTFD